jgi:3-methyladenine DNA glycosylase Tag
MPIDRKLIHFYELARSYVEEQCGDELQEMRQTSSPEYFQRISEEEFMTEYVWTVYAAGFKNSILEVKFPGLEKAFQNFNLDRICQMTSTAQVLGVINHAKKAEAVLEGARLVSKIGFLNFKEQLAEKGPDALVQLPYIGAINKNQLARNIGLASLHKNDVWIQRLVGLSGSRSDEVMINELSQKFAERPGIVDLILWRFCANGAWKSNGYSDFNLFFKNL